MKKRIVVLIIIIVVILGVLGIAPILNRITGNVVANGDSTMMNFESSILKDFFGVRDEETSQVLIRKQEPCMEECITRDCDAEYDFYCQRINLLPCLDECGESVDESEISEEQICLSDCINEIDSIITCDSGNEDCIRCVRRCSDFYDGPCLTNRLLGQEERSCLVQGNEMAIIFENGDSKQGYECAVNVNCINKTEVQGIIQEVNETEGILGFFNELFNIEEEGVEEIDISEIEALDFEIGDPSINKAESERAEAERLEFESRRIDEEGTIRINIELLEAENIGIDVVVIEDEIEVEEIVNETVVEVPFF